MKPCIQKIKIPKTIIYIYIYIFIHIWMCIYIYIYCAYHYQKFSSCMVILFYIYTVPCTVPYLMLLLPILLISLLANCNYESSTLSNIPSSAKVLFLFSHCTFNSKINGTPIGLSISKLHSILAVAYLLAHNNLYGFVINLWASKFAIRLKSNVAWK